MYGRYLEFSEGSVRIEQCLLLFLDDIGLTVDSEVFLCRLVAEFGSFCSEEFLNRYM